MAARRAMGSLPCTADDDDNALLLAWDTAAAPADEGRLMALDCDRSYTQITAKHLSHQHTYFNSAVTVNSIKTELAWTTVEAHHSKQFLRISTAPQIRRVLADNIVRFINLFTYLQQFLLPLVHYYVGFLTGCTTGLVHCESICLYSTGS